tara:strand:+ start:92361 stop:93395 length:1035 start_codon:yes stop_codon:yes gene_type:complete
MPSRTVLFAFLISTIVWITGCQIPFLAERPSRIHLVIDAGSSGTRFCPYRVDNYCAHVDPAQACLRITARSGLADLNGAEIQKVLDQGVQELEGMEIEKAVLLGTGGFRRLSESRRTKQLELIADELKKRIPNSESRVITGQQEANLAYIAMIAFRDGKTDHIILETGGATVQLAGSGLTARSAPAGLNEIRNSPDLPRECTEEADASSERFEACSKGLRQIFRSNRWHAAFFKDQDLASVYALGSSWQSIFTVAGKESLSLDELQNQGKRICNSSLDEIVKAGVPEKFAPASCYLHSYQYVLASELKIGTLLQGEGSWPPGAAISQYFEGCRFSAEGNGSATQ